MGAGDLEVVGMVTPLIGHLGGIHEIGIFLVPTLLAIFALRWAEKRAKQRAAKDDQQGDGAEDSLQRPASSIQEES